MSERPAPPPLHGLLVVDKPVGPTSMDVCRVVRRRAGSRRLKVGHAGALDPLASGVLVVAVGRATKLLGAVMRQPKEYEARVDLAAFSSTDDLEGEAQPVEVASPPTRERLLEALGRLTGEILQRPPAYSAVKIAGQRAYRLARRGVAVEPKPRPVVVHAIELLAYAWPQATLRIRCGKGVYIRSLARDLGALLGTGGRLAGLVRTAVGPYRLERAVPLDRIPSPLTQADLLAPPSSCPSSDAPSR